MNCVDCGRKIASLADDSPSIRDRCIPCGAKAGSPFADEPARKCPECGADAEDIVISIDETADCYVCNWKGHEDDLVEEAKVQVGNNECRCDPPCEEPK